MNLPSIKDLSLIGKRVLVRADLDVPFEGEKVLDDSRIVSCVPTFKYILENGAKSLLILGHIGKYEGADKTVSTAFLKDKIAQLLGRDVAFVQGMPPLEVPDSKVIFSDNVRLDKGEEENNGDFAKKLASLGDTYINESFATSHREHASIVALPRLLPHAAGLRFAEEVVKLSEIRQNPKRPLVSLISGIKKDKLDYAKSLMDYADKVLIGGRLPDYIGDEDPLRRNSKVLIAKLIPDKEDITIHSIELFKEEIKKAETIIVAGVLGKYEEEGHRQGTKEVLEAVANSSAFKLLGGGDSEAAISLFGLTDKFDWVSIGGGAMLEFLAKGTLPGIEALLS